LKDVEWIDNEAKIIARKYSLKRVKSDQESSFPNLVGEAAAARLGAIRLVFFVHRWHIIMNMMLFLDRHQRLK
jgi:hypothetical protein